jgi:NAD(P)H dehydrogenase (quinone)
MPVGKGRHSPIAADDQGRAIAALLKNPEGYIGTTIPLSGPVETDHEQMAAELSKALGRKIVFQNVSIDEYCQSAEKIGIPPFGINFCRGALVYYRNGRMSGSDNNVEKLTDRHAMTLGELARAHVDANAK